jgi:hypothetical protein
MVNEITTKIVTVLKSIKGRSLTKKTISNKHGLSMLLAGNPDIEIMTNVQFDLLKKRENGCFTKWSEDSSSIDWLDSDFQTYVDKLIEDLKNKGLPTSITLIMHKSEGWVCVGEYLKLENIVCEKELNDADFHETILEKIKPLPDVLVEDFNCAYDSVEGLSAQFIYLYHHICGIMEMYETRGVGSHLEIFRLLMRLGELKTLIQHYSPVGKRNKNIAQQPRKLALSQIIEKLKKRKKITGLTAKELWSEFISMLEDSDDFESVCEICPNKNQPDKWEVNYKDSKVKSHSMKFKTFQKNLVLNKKTNSPTRG